MDKIKLRLCAGTMCYVMGGAQLMEIEELLFTDFYILAHISPFFS